MPDFLENDFRLPVDLVWIVRCIAIGWHRSPGRRHSRDIGNAIDHEAVGEASVGRFKDVWVTNSGDSSTISCRHRQLPIWASGVIHHSNKKGSAGLAPLRLATVALTM